MCTFNRQKSLAIVLGNLKGHPNPKEFLEQYMLSNDVAAKILWFAGKVNDDLSGKVVLDLGCGTGILAIGAILLGADFAVGVDVDLASLKVALENAHTLHVDSSISFINSDISHLNLSADTVIQNPPFGVQRRGADRLFLKKAMESADVIYSLHKYTEKNHRFLMNFIVEHDGKVTHALHLTLTIPHLFPFHRRLKHKVNVVLYRILR